ncbi:MAG: VWA domain-containing protein [Eggerthellaceae bacterium]|nr:VWA domain-containing protein [Eggerthellaceae bacterium]
MNLLKKLCATTLALILACGLMVGCAASPASSDKSYYYENSGGAPTAAAPDGYYDIYDDYYYEDDYYSKGYPDYYLVPNTEEYTDITESGFISTIARPLSTFSSDVDTASYCNLRRMINEGYDLDSIPKNAVRIEEMLNYFNYDYAAPEGGNLFGLTSQVADCPWNPDTKLLVMGFATEKADYAEIAGSNFVFLIDTSGSMNSPDKLPLLQSSFLTLIKELDENDCISIVTYAGTERLVCEGVSGADKKGLARAIKNLSAGGSTNGEAGLELAYEIAQNYYIEGGNNRIIMASDGDLNVGMSSRDELFDYVSKQRETGVYLSVLGFGSGNYKDANMQTLADNGNGAYHYIDSLEEAQKVFGDDLCANLVTLAKDVKLQVEFNPAQVKGYRLIGYEKRAMADEDFENKAADAGEIGWGHQVTVAYELVLADSEMDIPLSGLKYRDTDTTTEASNEWLTCTVRYKSPATDKSYESRYVIDETSYTTRPSSDWNFAAAVIGTGMILRDSEHKGDLTLQGVEKLLGKTKAHDQYQREFAELIKYLYQD